MEDIRKDLGRIVQSIESSDIGDNDGNYNALHKQIKEDPDDKFQDVIKSFIVLKERSHAATLMAEALIKATAAHGIEKQEEFRSALRSVKNLVFWTKKRLENGKYFLVVPTKK